MPEGWTLSVRGWRARGWTLSARGADTKCQKGRNKVPEGRTLNARGVDTSARGVNTKCQRGGH